MVERQSSNCPRGTFFQLQHHPFARGDTFAGHGSNGDVVGDQDDQLAIMGLFGQEGPEGINPWFAIIGAIVKRIQSRQLLNGSQVHQPGGFQASTPLARIEASSYNPMAAKKNTYRPGLLPAAFVQIPLGRAIPDLEIRRIATARSIGMTNHENGTAGLESADRVKTMG